MAIGGSDPLAMQVVAEEPVWTSASVIVLGGKAPTGLGPPLRASLHGAGQHWPPGATRSNVARQPTPAHAQSPRRRELQHIHVYIIPAKGGGRTTTTTAVPHSPYANRSQHAHQQSNALQVNAHLPPTHIHSTTVRQTHNPNRAPISTPNRATGPTSNRPATPTPNRSPSPTHNRRPTPTPNRLASPTRVQSLTSNTDAV